MILVSKINIMTMIKNLLRVARRQLHTIISRETIKPSSPTSSHLSTYYLSEMDLINQNSYTPLLLFYPSNRDFGLTAEQKATMLKKSLSQSLTQYYPFTGRLAAPASTYVECNDEGVLFVEARNDGQLETFRCKSWDDESLDQLFADGLVFCKKTSCANPVAVQVNHFSCGGLGLAVSLSRAVGDGCTLGSFLSYWAAVVRYGSTDHEKVLPLNPHFILHPRIHPTQPKPKARKIEVKNNLVSRKFVFPNSKLSDLKNKVAFANPTRVEVLTSLLYKTAVEASTTKSGCFKPSYLFFMVNVRDKFVPKLPQSTVGTYVKAMMIETRDRSETSLSKVVGEIRKKKLQLEGIQSVQQLVEYTKWLMGKLGNGDLENVGKGSYWCSSLCGFAFNKLDFGWGKPMGTTLAIRSSKSEDRNGFVLMDTVDGKGIEVMVVLEKECMEIFENDKEMLSYCL